MNRLKEKYLKEVMPKLKEELKFTNNLAVPKVVKIAINVGIGDGRSNPGEVEKTLTNIAALSGQKPMTAKAKKAISGFKLSKGDPVGVMVTLRGQRMYEFLDKLITIVLPKVRDFRGLSDKSFDSQGNYSLGMREQNIFPEVAFQSSLQKGRGLEISIITTAKTASEGKKLLELLGMPFMKGAN